MDDEINLTEAAVLLGMSPELLKWLTSYAPKKGSPRKLPVARTVGKLPVFKTAELLAFNKWLAEPWPSEGDARPPIPTGIRDEIIREAAGQCALCHSNQDSCEAAHIEPVSQSKNNHPHNLIWLCANHHTKFDKGRLGPKPKDQGFVRNVKAVLLNYSKMLYEVKAEAVREAFYLIEACRRALELNPKTAEQRALAQTIGEEAIKKVVGVAKRKTKENKGEDAFKKLREITSSKQFEPSRPVADRLSTLATVREEFRIAAGLVECPLCKGTGRRNGGDCPYCGGDGAVIERAADLFDPRDYETVNCPLCKGSGRGAYGECAVCHGDREMERRFADAVDLHEYAMVECPLCEGSGHDMYGECSVCHGERQMERRFADAVDLRDYDMVNCPLCQGAGGHNYEDCPACGGERKMPRRLAERIDVSQYDLVECPLCDATGVYRGENCKYCGGERHIESRYAERFDRLSYEMVKCPICNGKGGSPDGDCNACGGGGEVSREDAERLRDRY